MTAGKVYFVGAGPGAPDLLTVRAAEVLRRADMVFYDALVHPDTVALAVDAERIPVGKRCGRHSTAQRFINKRLIDAAQTVGVVVRLKGGDPMLFGRAQEEIAALQKAGIQFEVVPGVTAALAASADVGVSLTARGRARSVAFLTPRIGEGEKPNEWARAAAASDTAVIYMGAGEADMIAAALLAQGLQASTPVLVVENASLPERRQFRLALGELPCVSGFGLTGPVLIMIGDVYRQIECEAAPGRLRAAQSA